MPARNNRGTVEEAIESVLAQDGVDLTLVVVDDGSTDGTADVTRSFEDPRIRLISNPRKRGVARCHNQVIERCDTAFLAEVSATDRLVPHALSRLVDAVASSGNVALAQCYHFEIDCHGSVDRDLFRARAKALGLPQPPELDNGSAPQSPATIVNPLRLYRPSVFAELSGMSRRRRRAENHAMAGQMPAGYKVRVVPEFLYGRQVGPDGRLDSVRSLRRAAVVRWRAVRRRRAGLGQRLYRALSRTVRWWPVGLPRRSRGVPASTTGRVAYVVSAFPRATETFVQREVRALRTLGLHVEVMAWSHAPTGTLDARARELIADTIYLGPADPSRLRRYARRYARRHPLRYAGLLVYVLARRSGGRETTLRQDRTVFDRGVYLAGMIEDRGLERIHLPWATVTSVVALVASRLVGVPFTVQARAYDIHAPMHDYGLTERVAHAERVITNSHYNVDHLQSVVPKLPPERLHHVYEGVDPTSFRPGDTGRETTGPSRILFIGRLVEQKGIEYLLRACAILRRDGRAFECHVVGPRGGRTDTNLYVRLRRLQRALDLEKCVRFRGGLPYDQVLDEYQASDLLVLPAVIAESGRRDITPNVLLEAMAMKLPVVSTRLVAVPEIVEDGVSGLLVPPGDESALAGALARLLDDPELRRRFGEEGRRKVEADFDSRRNARRLAELIAPGALVRVAGERC